jgi:hypothetical protein
MRTSRQGPTSTALTCDKHRVMSSFGEPALFVAQDLEPCHERRQLAIL